MRAAQITLKESKVYVGMFHAHSDEHVGHKWSLAALADGQIVGVAVIGRPTARVIQQADPWALEVLRVCVERVNGCGYPNACSFLYGAAWRSIKAMGYLRALTYTKDGEHGASIRAAGWLPLQRRDARSEGWGSRDDRASAGFRAGGERWEIKAKDWRADLPCRPRVVVAPRRNQLSLEAA